MCVCVCIYTHNIYTPHTRTNTHKYTTTHKHAYTEI